MPQTASPPTQLRNLSTIPGRAFHTACTWVLLSHKASQQARETEQANQYGCLGRASLVSTENLPSVWKLDMNYDIYHSDVLGGAAEVKGDG